MRYWLKMIGTADDPNSKRYEKRFVDFSRNRRPRHIHTGDHLVLYASGGLKRVFAIAEVVGEVYEQNEYPRWPYRVDVEYSINLDPSEGVHINEVSTPHRDLLRSLPRQSYLELRPEEYEQAAAKLKEAEKASSARGA